MGTLYLAEKIEEFGGIHLALASYNAGERPVHRWKAERPNLPQDEFIDDIPYPETQNYVKIISKRYGKTYHPVLPPAEAAQVFQLRTVAAD